jgi:2-phosphoglycerate kinase
MKKTDSPSNNSFSQPYYSSDLLARSLVRAGFPRYKAYNIAHTIWEEIGTGRKDETIITKKVLTILKKKHPEFIQRFKQWQKIMKRTKPVIILLGGGTGIGTSTLAVRLTWLLEINQVLGTDSIREVVRRFLPKALEPILNVSTFETGEHIKVVKSYEDAVIYGFLSQSKKVLYGIEAVIKRSIKESASVIIEGVHLVPGEMEFLKEYKSKATIVQILLDVEQPETHRQHFFKRHLQNANRPKNKYLEYFNEIRLIRDFLVTQAKKNEVPVIENYSLNHAEREIIDTIYSLQTSKK